MCDFGAVMSEEHWSGYRFPVEAVVFSLWFIAGLVGTFVVPGPDKAYNNVRVACFKFFNILDYIEFYYGPHLLVVIYCMFAYISIFNELIF